MFNYKIFLLIFLPLFLFLFLVISANKNTTHAAVACGFISADVTYGNQVGIITTGLVGHHNVKLVGQTYGNIVTVGSIDAGSGGTGGGNITIPFGISAPQRYEVKVDSGFGGDILCTSDTGATYIQINLPITGTGCAFDRTSVRAGESIQIVTSGLPGYHATQLFKPSGALTFPLPGTIGSTGGTVAIPTSTPTSTYNVEVDSNFGPYITCAGTLRVVSGGVGGDGTTECDSFADCTAVNSVAENVGGFTYQGFIVDLVSKFLPIAIGLGGFLSVIIVVVSGLQFMTSNGNPEGAAAARGRLIFALVGFVLLTLAFAIAKVIDTLLLRGSGIF